MIFTRKKCSENFRKAKTLIFSYFECQKVKHKKEAIDMYFIPYKVNEFLENSFYQVPKELFANPYYTDLSLASKVLYGLLLDRLSLSIKNKWTDKDGDIYIIFSRKEAQEKLNLSDKTVTKAFKELKNKKLIREKRTGFKKNNIIYVGKINHVKMYES